MHDSGIAVRLATKTSLLKHLSTLEIIQLLTEKPAIQILDTQNEVKHGRIWLT